MKIAVCPGSFDPITLGHIDVINRAAKLFDQVIVLISVNAAKRSVFTKEERVELAKKATAHLQNAVVDSDDGDVYKRQSVPLKPTQWYSQGSSLSAR